MVELCEICKETIPIGKCMFCGKRICRHCAIYVECLVNPQHFLFEMKPLGKKMANEIRKKKVNKSLVCKLCWGKVTKFWFDRKEKLSNDFLKFLSENTLIEKL